jgi:ketosteroid isomerase-like protein
MVLVEGPFRVDPGDVTADVPAFLELFQRFGAAPSVDTYLPLFHPDATLFDSGMERPIGVAEIPEHIGAILNWVPDFRMTPERWRERDGTLFVEALNRATLGGTPVRWDSIYCMDLRGDRVVRGRRYYDRRPLFARLNPDIPALVPYAKDDPISLGELARLLPDLTLQLVSRAGDEALAFVEWRARATVAGAPFAFGIAERSELDGGIVRGGRAYFDTLALAARRATG